MRLKTNKKSRGFTLPEVIVSVAVLVMVITAATDILSNVIRSNSDNLNSLLADGYAQEGLEAIRYIRDTDYWLGLDFDGAKGSGPDLVWGEKLFEGESTKAFKINQKEVALGSCTKVNLSECLPIGLEVMGVDEYQDMGKGFSRAIVIKAIKSEATLANVDVLRVTSMVTWNGINNVPRKVVLTTELTDWKNEK
ncbi:prepilin-type N-terminal cleavage/methylation domain-containing protein [Candidatus Peregrinibacteria bacterium]|nr:prepilin-type N-terminal cleavage/methylation domain-containing protein [Candidatus Peregrinibacteria bacterium]